MILSSVTCLSLLGLSWRRSPTGSLRGAGVLAKPDSRGQADASLNIREAEKLREDEGLNMQVHT